MEKNYPKISVITPNYNQGAFLEQTIRSVVNQQYPNLEYIIIDGGSTDASVTIIKKYEKQLAYWVSEKDKGMYHAIKKGFDKAAGDIMCWINSDDVLWENSLHYVAKIFTQNPNIHWLQGYPSVINEEDTLLYQREPICNASYFYNYSFVKSLAFIQQESTFWTRSLWEKSNGINTTYQLAADFDLWMQFFSKEKLYCCHQQLGAFRKREGQQSENIEHYIVEAKRSVAFHKKEQTFLKRMCLIISNFLLQKKDKINWID